MEKESDIIKEEFERTAETNAQYGRSTHQTQNTEEIVAYFEKILKTEQATT